MMSRILFVLVDGGIVRSGQRRGIAARNAGAVGIRDDHAELHDRPEFD